MQSSFVSYLALFATALFITAFLMRYYIHILRARGILEKPNPRSSHFTPMPTGGGWIVLCVAFLLWLPLLTEPGVRHAVFLCAVLGVAIISWLDDVRPRSPLLRLAVHGLAVAACLALIPSEARVLWGELPLWVDRTVVGLCWIWFINLYNFMDGIDGIAAVETISICLGLLVLSQIVEMPGDSVLLSVLMVGATAGFLLWNWHPAKIFLGDVGAIPLGFIIGWLLIQLALNKHAVAAFVLPLFYLSDATITLAKRIMRGERFWSAHRQHFYQLPVVAGLPHSTVVLRIIPANAALVGAAVLSVKAPVAGLMLAIAITAALLVHLHLLAQRRQG